ncbi:MAG: hypothetical protein VYA25_07240 [Pseudomonadota bacterium]|nr:hypothetical protein [Pseudomonadota bacterium]
MTTIRKPAAAAAAAAFALSSRAAVAAEPPAGSSGRALAADDTVHCYDLHSCKGQSDCATAEHDCKGQNACKGHGFKARTACDCLATGGTIGDLG